MSRRDQMRDSFRDTLEDATGDAPEAEKESSAEEQPEKAKKKGEKKRHSFFVRDDQFQQLQLRMVQAGHKNVSAFLIDVLDLPE